MTQDRENALDQAQESFVKAFKAIRTFKGDATFKTWLASIALNTTKSYLKKKGREKFEFGSQETQSPETPEEELQKSQRKRKLITALQKLKAEHREVIQLCAIEDFSYTQTAQILKIPVGTVCSRMNAALSDLRAVLSKEEHNG